MMNQVTTKKVRKVNRGSRTMERWYALCARSTNVRMSTNRMRAARAARMGENSQERAYRQAGERENARVRLGRQPQCTEWRQARQTACCPAR